MATRERQVGADSAVLPDLGRADDGVSFDQIFATFRRRLWLVLTIVALGTGLAVLAGHLVTPKYTATAALVIDPTDSRLVDTAGRGNPGSPTDPGTVQTQIGLILSRSHLRQAVEHLAALSDAEPGGIGQPNGEQAVADAGTTAVEEGERALKRLMAEGSDQPPLNGGAESMPLQTGESLGPDTRASAAIAEEARINLPAPLHELASRLPESWLIAVGFAKEARPHEVSAGVPLSPEEEDGSQQNAPTLLRALAWLFPQSWLEAAGLPAPVDDQPSRSTSSAEVPLEWFGPDLEVYQAGTSAIINVSYTSTDPEKAAWVANGVADSYVASQVESKQAAARRAAEWLRERVDELRASVRLSEAAVAEYASTHGLVVGPAASLNDQKLMDLNAQLAAIRSLQFEREAQLRLARQGQISGEDAEVMAEISGSPFLLSLRNQEAELLREQAELLQTYGERHPKIVNVRAKLAEVQSKITGERNRAIRNLEEQIAVLASREQAVIQTAEDLKQEISADQRLGDRLQELEREAEANRKLFTDFLTRLKAAEKQMQVSTPDVHVISRAAVPLTPSTPGPPVFAMIGFTVSLMFSSFIALLLERLDRRVRSASDLEVSLGLRVLGLMPRLPSRVARRRPHHYVLDKPFSDYAEAARSILTSLRFSGSDAAPSVLLVTSALPNEGKSTFALTLATTAARSGLKVLLIDLDMRRPSLASLLTGRHSLIGLVDYLAGQMPAEQLIQRDARTGVHFILGGRPPHNPLELMQDSALKGLIESSRQEYAYIILDSAPVLAVADARVATRLADQVVLVGRWKRTDVAAIGHALRSLFAVGAELAGCVVTGVNLRKYKHYASDAGSYYSRYKEYRTN